MQRSLQHRLDALQRVQAFLDTHQELPGALGNSAARHELDAAVTAVLEATHLQAASPLAMAALLSRQRALVKTIKRHHMQPIAAFARARLRGVPDYAALTRSTKRLSATGAVRAARAMATAAAPHAAALAENGFPADEVSQLESLAKAAESAYAERGSTRVTMIGATKAISVQLARGRDAVQILNGVLSTMLAGNASLQAEWNAAKRVTANTGVARGSTAGAAAQQQVPQAA